MDPGFRRDDDKVYVQTAARCNDRLPLLRSGPCFAPPSPARCAGEGG
jgi:hypothetical protein